MGQTESMTTSEQITALCDELGIEKPSQTAISTPSVHDCTTIGVYKVYTVSDLLKFLSELDHEATPVVEVGIGIIGAGMVDGSWSPGFDLDVYDDDPDTALQLLAVKRLQEIKRERE